MAPDKEGHRLWSSTSNLKLIFESIVLNEILKLIHFLAKWKIYTVHMSAHIVIYKSP